MSANNPVIGQGSALTFLGLPDTMSNFNLNRVPYESGSALIDSSLFTYNGSKLKLEKNSLATVLEVYSSGDGAFELQVETSGSYVEQVFSDFDGNYRHGLYLDDNNDSLSFYNYGTGNELITLTSDDKIGFLQYSPRTSIDFDLGGAQTSGVYSGDFYITNDANTADNLTIQLASGATGDTFINFGNPTQRDASQLIADFSADGGSGTLRVHVQNGTVCTWGDGYMDMGSSQSYMADTYLQNDTYYLFFGAGDDAKMWYDGTNFNIHTDLVAPSDLHIDCGTDKTLVLDETVYDDFSVPIIYARLGATAPTLTTFVGNISQYTFDNTNDYVEGALEILHDYKEGTDIEIHLHWATNGTDASDRTVKWQLEYSITNLDSFLNAFPSPTTVSAETIIPTATAVDRAHVVTSIGTISGTGLEIGAIVVWRLSRIASSGTEPSNNPFALQLGLHYQKDTLGSRQPYIK